MNKIIGLYLIASFLLISCNQKNKNANTNLADFESSNNQDKQSMTVGQDKFSYDFHLANHQEKQVEDKGQTDFEKFTVEFEKFPWLDQLDEANRIGKTSPTISVHSDSSTTLWVSILGDRNSFGYMIGYNYPKTKKGLLGLGKEKTIKWVEMRLTDEKNTVIKCYELYFKKDTSTLRTELNKLELYGETESQ